MARGGIQLRHHARATLVPGDVAMALTPPPPFLAVARVGRRFSPFPGHLPNPAPQFAFRIKLSVLMGGRLREVGAAIFVAAPGVQSADRRGVYPVCHTLKMMAAAGQPAFFPENPYLGPCGHGSSVSSALGTWSHASRGGIISAAASSAVL